MNIAIADLSRSLSSLERLSLTFQRHADLISRDSSGGLQSLVNKAVSRKWKKNDYVEKFGKEITKLREHASSVLAQTKEQKERELRKLE